ncbi:MAG: cysteine dioxygenase family protein [Ilumatobacteraceae bacterium]
MTAAEGSTTTGRVDDEALAAIAAGLADADPGAFLTAGSCRRWALIASNELYSAWVIAWPAGTGLGMHDHGGSSAAVQVVRGILRERYVAEGGDDAGGLAVRWLDPGSLHVLPGDHRHEVVNVGDAEAVSVHVYSPPLVETSFRDDPEIDLR